jgi:ATP-dependent Clp protease ATP-binding subunit ClpB
MGVVRIHFRPEFLNRVDEIVVFARLTREQLAEIVTIQIERLRRRLAGRRVDLALAPAAIAWLAEHGYDPTYGARPLQRLIRKEVEDPLAIAILEGRFGEGDTVTVDTVGERLILR